MIPRRALPADEPPREGGDSPRRTSPPCQLGKPQPAMPGCVVSRCRGNWHLPVLCAESWHGDGDGDGVTAGTHTQTHTEQGRAQGTPARTRPLVQDAGHQGGQQH